MAEDLPWDYSHLPMDALCVVFEHVFRPEGEAAALPLSLALERWRALQLVCSHWREVRGPGQPAASTWRMPAAVLHAPLPPAASWPPTPGQRIPARAPRRAQVLVGHPPPMYLAVSTLPEALLPWLLRLPLAALCVQDRLDAVSARLACSILVLVT